MILEEVHGFFHVHVQHFVNVLSLVGNLQGFPIISLALAYLAGNENIRQEVHFDFQQTVSAAGFASPALHVKGKAILLIAPCLCLRALGEDFANHVKQAGVGGRIASGSAANGTLVNHDDLVQLLHALHAAELTGAGLGSVQHPCQMLVQNLIDQAALSRSADACHAAQHPQRNFHINVLQVMFLCAVNGQPSGRRAALLWHGNSLLAGKVLPRQAFRAGLDVLDCALRHNVAPVNACSRTYVHNPVGSIHGIFIVLHHNEGIA